MGVDVVVLNGGSSSGTTSLARCLQRLLPGVWLRWSIDDLVDALPAAEDGSGTGAAIAFPPGGGVAVGAAFRDAETAWVAGLAAMARAAVGVVVVDVFLDGAASQERVRSGLDGLRVLWVGVHCRADVAVVSQLARGDRPTGMAAAQAEVVHRGVAYDVEVDTTDASPEQAARTVAAAVLER